MSTPIILIGIGTSGLYALEHAQRFYYESSKDANKANKPSNVEYLYIETNETNRPTGTPIGNDITRVYVSLDDMADMVRELKQTCNNPGWLPDSRIVLSAGLGAGGIRSCGRLAMWGRNQRGDNFRNVIEAIKNAHSRVMNVNNNDKNSSNKPAVIVTGSLTGGTGSGVFIDMGYIVRHVIPSIKDIYGLFMLPSNPATMMGNEVMYGNAYGALKDLDYFNKVENNYVAKWPSGFDKNEEAPPYELVQFISQDRQDGSPAIGSLDGLYKLAGLFLFLNIAGIYEKRRERLVDAAGNSLIGKYGTFGLSAIQFPKDQIQELLAAKLSIELCTRMAHPTQYSLNGQQREIPRAIIKQEMSAAFDGLLDQAFSSLNNVEHKDLLLDLSKEAVKINKGEIKGNPVDHITTLFNSSGDSNFYAMANNNIKSGTSVVIDGIHELVDRALQATESLYYARTVLESLVSSIEDALNFWRSIGLSSQPQNWDNELRKLAMNAVKNRYKLLLEQDNVLRDRLIAIFDALKMHLFIRPLIDICKHVREGQIRLEGRLQELPKLKFFDDALSRINALVGRNEEMETGRMTFPKRISGIRSDINDTTLPILRVYPSNSFERECEKAEQTYNQKAGSAVRSVKDVLGQQNLFNYLKDKLSGRFLEDVYQDFQLGYRRKVNQLGCVEDYNVAAHILKQAEESSKTAKKATSPFLRIGKVLHSNQGLPRFIVGDDVNEITSVIKAFQDVNYNEFADKTDGKKEIQELANIMVFYDELGNYSPLEDITYISLMRDSYSNMPAGLSDPNMTQERWVANRSAYDTK
jgi:hypothetical protein